MCFYRRNLPHWQPGQAEYFITFRLAVSLPPGAIERLKSLQYYLENTNLDPSLKQSRMFAKYETLLDGLSIGPTWLKNKSIAGIVYDALHYRDQKEYDLYAFCVMPNHVHLAFKLLDQNETEHKVDFPVTKMFQELKRYTAVEYNKVLNRKGQF